MNYRKLLEHSYSEHKHYIENKDMSRLEYLGEEIFYFTTYEDEIVCKMAKKCLEVCCAISENATFDYIKSEDGHLWYLIMANMPFISGRIDWGTSIRGAWWSIYRNEEIVLKSYGLYVDGEQILELRFKSRDEWDSFIFAMKEFAENE